MSSDGTVAQVRRLARASVHRRHVGSMKAAWSSWDAFADYHGLDPHGPKDTDLVAFVRARALAGVGVGSLSSTLAAVRTSLTGSPRLTDRCVTLPAQRQLVLLHREGEFDPAEPAAPLLTVGQVFGIVESAIETGTPKGLRDAAAVAVTYGAALRPEELRTLQAEHVGVLSDGTVRLQVQIAKTGEWQSVDIGAQMLGGCGFGQYRHLGGLIRAYSATVGEGQWLRSVATGRPINQPGLVLTGAAAGVLAGRLSAGVLRMWTAGDSGRPCASTRRTGRRVAPARYDTGPSPRTAKRTDQAGRGRRRGPSGPSKAATARFGFVRPDVVSQAAGTIRACG